MHIMYNGNVAPPLWVVQGVHSELGDLNLSALLDVRISTCSVSLIYLHDPIHVAAV